MWLVNDLRAHLNSSLDKQMKVYAKCMREKGQDKQAHKQLVQVTAFPNDMALPSVEDVLKTNSENVLLHLNDELINHVDDYSNYENEESDM